jgi:glycosyltransferase involved in cell wall biosynthesis
VDWRADPHPDGHGANHRSDQMRALLEAAGFRCVRATGTSSVGRVTALRSGLLAARATRLHGQRDWRLRSARFAGSWHADFEGIRKQEPGIRCLLWEATHQPARGFLAREVGWRVVAVPQNVEALQRPIPRNREERAQRLRLIEQEATSLSYADRVFCISDEDAWLLRGLGVPASVLPYFPSPALEARLLEIRAERQASPPNGPVLVLGCLSNPDAIEGFRAFMTELDAVLAAVGQTAVAAGLGTDRHLLPGLSSRIDCRGWLDAAAFRQCLVDARALVVHQDAGGGALTRIPEALLCGLPVIANRVAARSARHYDGVHCVDSADGLRELLGGDVPTPRCPARPTRAEQAFVACVRELAA